MLFKPRLIKKREYKDFILSYFVTGKKPNKVRFWQIIFKTKPIYDKIYDVRYIRIFGDFILIKNFHNDLANLLYKDGSMLYNNIIAWDEKGVIDSNENNISFDKITQNIYNLKSGE